MSKDAHQQFYAQQVQQQQQQQYPMAQAVPVNAVQPVMQQQYAPQQQQYAPQQQQQQQMMMMQQQPVLYPGQMQPQNQQYIGGGVAGPLDRMFGRGGGGGDPAPWKHLIQKGQQLVPVDLSALEGRGAFYMRQEIDGAEVLAEQLGCGCVEISNKYVLFDQQTKDPLLYIKETNVNQLERCCCKPYHSLTLEAYDIRPGQAQANSLAMMVKKPLRICGGCFACFDCCRPEATAFNSQGAKLGRTVQPFMGNGFTPTVEIMDRNDTPFARAEGPACVFGGCVETCSETVFQVYMGSREPVATIKKDKPKSWTEVLTSGVTDADAFEFALPPNMPVDQKATMISSLLLLDYMFFENGAAVSRKIDGSISCTLFELYCCGCTCPCTCESGNNNGGG